MSHLKPVWFAIHDQMAEKHQTLKSKIMELNLNVKTVQTFEPTTFCPHTAYTVYLNLGENLLVASAWTLKDAIALFAETYKYNKSAIKVQRPFRPQTLQISDYENIL